MPARRPAELHTLFRMAFNLRDLDSLAALYEPDATLMVDGNPVSGRANIRTALGSILDRRADMILETRSVIESPDGLAILHGAWVVSPAETAFGPATRGLSTELARKQPNGTWLLVIDNPYTPTAD